MYSTVGYGSVRRPYLEDVGVRGAGEAAAHVDEAHAVAKVARYSEQRAAKRQRARVHAALARAAAHVERHAHHLPPHALRHTSHQHTSERGLRSLCRRYVDALSQ